MVLVYANAVKLIFFQPERFYVKWHVTKGFIVKTLDIPLHFGLLLQGEGMYQKIST